MNKELFIKQIELMQKFNNLMDTLESLSVNLVLSDLFTYPAIMFDNSIEFICTDEGSDLVFWWMYESVPKVIYEKVGDEEVETSVETLDELYDYLNKHNLFLY